MLLGVALWACVHAGGLHATLGRRLAGSVHPDATAAELSNALAVQADTILAAEARHGGEQLRRGPSEPALRAFDAIHDRLESPADRMLRMLGPRSSYLVLADIRAWRMPGVVDYARMSSEAVNRSCSRS